MTAYAKRMKSNWIVDSCSDGPSDFIQSVFQMLPQEGLQVCVCEGGGGQMGNPILELTQVYAN